MPSAAMAHNNVDKDKDFAAFIAKKCKDLEKQVKNFKKMKDEAKPEDLMGIEEKYKHISGQFNVYKDIKQQLKKCSVNGKRIVFANEVEEESETEQKKAERYSAFEVRKIQMVLKNQTTLSNLQNPRVREDFLEGRNGAIKLTESNMDDLDKLYKLITPPSLEEKPKTNEEVLDSLLECAKHLFNLTEGKSKEETKEKIVYRGVRQLVHKVSLCNYSPVFNNVQDESSLLLSPSEEQSIPASSDPASEVNEVCNSPTITEIKEENDSPNIPDEDQNQNISPKLDEPIQNVPKVSQNGIESPTLPIESPQPPVNIESSNSSSINNNDSNDYQEHIVMPNLQPDPVTFNQDHHLLHSKVMTVKNFLMARNMSFLQDSQLPGQEILMDPAVVTFGSIKPDCYMNMDDVHVDVAVPEVKEEKNEMAQFEEDVVRKPAVLINETSNVNTQVFMANKFELPAEEVGGPVDHKEIIEQLEHDVSIEPRSPTELTNIGRMEFVNPKYQQNLSQMVSNPNFHGIGAGAVPGPQNHIINLNQVQQSMMQSTQNPPPSAVPDEYQDPMKIKEDYNVPPEPQEPLKMTAWADEKEDSFSNGIQSDNRNGWVEENKSYRNDDYNVWEQDMQWHDPEKEDRNGYRGGRGNRRPSGAFRGRSFSNSHGPRGVYNNGYRGRGNGFRGRPNFRNNGNPRGNSFRSRGSYNGNIQRN